MQHHEFYEESQDQQLKQQMQEFLNPCIAEQKVLFVACSGGCDSMYLLTKLAETCSNIEADSLGQGLSVEVLHVNYKLRGASSEADEQLVREYCRQLDLPLRVHRPLKQAPRKGIQVWARRERQAWFQSLLQERPGIVALGHQCDDLAENALLRLSRGTGSNLAGMRRFDPPYWRPLLHLRRQWIRTACSRQKVPFRDDESNARLVYSRNRIRLQVLPQLEALHPGAGGRIADHASDQRDVHDFLGQHFAAVIVSRMLSYAAIQEYPQGVQLFVMAAFIKHHAGVVQMHRDQLLRLLNRMSDDVDLYCEDLPGPKRLRVKRGRLELFDKRDSFSLRSSQHRANIQLSQMPSQIELGATLELMATVLGQRSTLLQDGKT